MAEASGGRTHRRQENLPPAGFEDRDDHRTACASVFIISILTNTLPGIHKSRSCDAVTELADADRERIKSQAVPYDLGSSQTVSEFWEKAYCLSFNSTRKPRFKSGISI